MVLIFNCNDQHHQYLDKLPKIILSSKDIDILHSPEEFRYVLLQNIHNARKRIYLVTLYLEQDKGGYEILEAIFNAKKNYPTLKIIILVDWHRAQRGRIESISSYSTSTYTNAHWYCRMAELHLGIEVPIYGVPVNTREALGVLHLKGFIIDDKVIYSGASLNNVYLNQEGKYRYDRYQIIKNKTLSEIMLNYIDNQFLTASAVKRLDNPNYLKNLNIKHNIRIFRQSLRKSKYNYKGNATINDLSITPLVGLGKKNLLNRTIHHLICSTNNKLILCTPYFNIPSILMRDLIKLLKNGKKIEIIVGDKISNDFYIPKEEPFKIIGIIPYIYEMNLIRFIIKLQNYIDTKQLIVRIWKNGNNSFHLKGIWIDNRWQLLTGNNFNPRAWRLDLENALLIHDPNHILKLKWEKELIQICKYTKIVNNYTTLQHISDYPIKIQKLIRNLRRTRIDNLIKQIL